MRLIRLSLIVGGLFNLSMGIIFLHGDTLQWFFATMGTLERLLFEREVLILIPEEPLYRLLIHGFGAGVVILGATLLYSRKVPEQYQAFILIDGLGRLLFSGVMFFYVWTFSLPKVIFLFGLVEFSLAVIYIWGSWFLRKGQA